MKLQESNFYSCLSVILFRAVLIWLLSMMHWTSLYRVPVPPPPDIGYGIPLASDIWWVSLETCSNLFIEPHCTASPVQTSGGHQSIYGCQVVGTHPTWIFSCPVILFVITSCNKVVGKVIFLQVSVCPWRGMCGGWGDAWWRGVCGKGGMHGKGGACVVKGGHHEIQSVNARLVHILLECILVRHMHVLTVLAWYLMEVIPYSMCRAMKMKGMVFRSMWVYSKEDTMAHTCRPMVTS